MNATKNMLVDQLPLIKAELASALGISAQELEMRIDEPELKSFDDDMVTLYAMEVQLDHLKAGNQPNARDYETLPDFVKVWHIMVGPWNQDYGLYAHTWAL